MRIGIVTQYYYPIPGGISEHVHYLAKNLKDLGHQPSIITSRFFRNIHSNNTNHDLDVIRIGWNVPVPIPINGSFGNVNIGYRIGNKLVGICQEKKFDLIHIHSPLEPVLPLIVLSKINIPKVGTFHTAYSKFNLAYEIFRYQLKNYADQLDCRIAVSRSAKEFIEQYFPEEYFIIPNGVDLNRFNLQVKPLDKFNDGIFNILFVGRMDPRKGLKYLFKAFPLIYKQYPHCRLIVVGEGWLRDYYRMYLPSYLSDKVTFEGYVSRDVLPRYYASADVFCAPSTGGESFGIALLEAMASGKPIVASAIKGYRDLITYGQEGFTVSPKDPEMLKENILKLIKDKDLRKRMGEKGLIKSREYSWDKVVKKIEDCYKKVLAKYR